MRIPISTAAGLCLLLAPSYAADAEAARLATHRFKDAYWNCLAQEAVKALPRKMAGSDFVIFIKGRCLDEVKQFRIALVDYLAIKHPDVQMPTHLMAADQTIQAALADISSTYVDLKTKDGR